MSRVMTPEQDLLFQEINNSWPIDTYEVADDGEVSFVCDDGSTGTISADGSEWSWS